MAGASAGSILAVCHHSGLTTDVIAAACLELAEDCRKNGTRGRLGVSSVPLPSLQIHGLSSHSFVTAHGFQGNSVNLGEFCIQEKFFPQTPFLSLLRERPLISQPSHFHCDDLAAAKQALMASVLSMQMTYMPCRRC